MGDTFVISALRKQKKRIAIDWVIESKTESKQTIQVPFSFVVGSEELALKSR